jgi:2-polyprenyl-3-methyl-5-hydroxy-6-metoxy-1,4-benzoquinol methylase
LSNELWPTPYTSDVIPHDETVRGTGEDGIYLRFENIFRGSEDFIRERQRAYVSLVHGHEPVLDVGCGRGEFLELLAEAGIDGRGVDVSPAMVAHARRKGLWVEEADANGFLQRQDDGSFGTVFSAQVIEHMRYEELLKFLALALAKLRPGGLLISETVNPHSLPALKMFRVDLTHVSPIFPEVAVTLARLTGFVECRVFYPNGGGDAEEDRRGQGEYALVAYKA